jgi:hypothetical protein
MLCAHMIDFPFEISTESVYENRIWIRALSRTWPQVNSLNTNVLHVRNRVPLKYHKIV